MASLSKRFKKLMKNPVFQFVVVAAVTYFTAGAGTAAAAGATGGTAAGAGAGAGVGAGTGAGVGAGVGAGTGTVAGTTAGAATGVATGVAEAGVGAGVGTGATEAAVAETAGSEILAAEGAKQTAAAEILAAENVSQQAAQEGITQAVGEKVVEEGGKKAVEQGVSERIANTQIPDIQAKYKPGMLQRGKDMAGRTGAFVEKNPMASAMMFQGISGALSEDPAEEAARRERERWAGMQVPGSVGYSGRTRPLYTVDGQPVYNSRGIINRGMR